MVVFLAVNVRSILKAVFDDADIVARDRGFEVAGR